MARRETKPAAGLYKNGARYWVRTVRAPLSGIQKSLSTGTADTSRANAIKAMLVNMAGNPTMYEWLDAAVNGLPLDQIFTHYAAGSLHELRSQRAAAVVEADLDPLVTKWIDEHLATRDISERVRATYTRQIRVLIPEGVRFPASAFTEDTLKAKLASLTGARHDRTAGLTGGARRRYVAAWALFFKYARKRIPGLPNPFEDTEWLPENGDSRSTVHEFDKVRKVLDLLDAEDAAALALMYGSGIELGALLVMKRGDVSMDEQTIVAHGTKTEYRERTILVRDWAWKLFWAHAETRIGARTALWSYNAGTVGKDLRERFYWAQVCAGLIEEPPVNEATGKRLWGRVKPHTLHDCRHSLCVNAGLGLDGEEPWDTETLSHQLGHGDEQMVIGIYKKTNMKERQRRLLARREQQKAAKAAGGK